MNRNQELASEERELKQALQHFKASMDAWSEAELSRPRTAARQAPRHSWHRTAGWALGCVLAAGSLTGAVHEAVQRHEAALLAAHKAAPIQATASRQAALATDAQTSSSRTAAAEANASAQNEDLLATVDSEVSQMVPEAMEPLAQLMDNSGTK